MVSERQPCRIAKLLNKGTQMRKPNLVRAITPGRGYMQDVRGGSHSGIAKLLNKGTHLRRTILVYCY